MAMENLLLTDNKSVSLLSKYFKSKNFDVLFYYIFRKEPSKIPWGQLGMFFSSRDLE